MEISFSNCRFYSKSAFRILVLNTVFFLFFFICFDWNYETNDDLAMSLIGSGAYGDYTARIVFINIFMGKILKCLFTVVPFIPWYMLMHYITIFSSLFVITYILCQTRRTWGNVISILILSYLGYECYVCPQFTKTAGIAAIAGTALIVYALEQKKYKKLFFFIGWMLTIIGSMIRFEMYLLVLLFFLPLGVKGIFTRYRDIEKCRKQKIKSICNYILLWAIIILCTFAFKILDSYLYNIDEEWESYVKYNEERAILLDHGFPDYEKNLDGYMKLGITESDLALFETWNFADPDIFNIKSMKQLIDLKEKKVINFRYILNFFHIIIAGSLEEKGLFLILLMCPIMYIFKIKIGISSLYLGFSTLILNFYFFYNDRYLQNRVDVIIWGTIIVVITLLSELPRTDSLLKLKKGTIIAICIILCVDLYATNYVSRDINQKENAENAKEIIEAIASDQENLYICDVGSDRYDEAFEWLKNEPKGFRCNFYLLGGWQTHSPTSNAILDNYDVYNPYCDMVDRQNIYLIDSTNIGQKISYINRHYNSQATAVLVKDIYDTKIYKIVTSHPQLNLEKITKNNKIESEMDCNIENGTISIQGYAFMDKKKSWKEKFYTVFYCEDKDKKYCFYSTQKVMNDANCDVDKFASYETLIDMYDLEEGNYLVTQVVEIEEQLYSIGTKKVQVKHE